VLSHRHYISIRDNEQRRRYKADFTADYSEYRDLHAEVEKVSKRFALLEERLKQEERNSVTWKVIHSR
jgi:Occludin homology domain.